jgi:hypothetical protein
MRSAGLAAGGTCHRIWLAGGGGGSQDRRAAATAGRKTGMAMATGEAERETDGRINGRSWAATKEKKMKRARGGSGSGPRDARSVEVEGGSAME